MPRFELPSGRDRILIRNGCYDHGTAERAFNLRQIKRSINTINIFNIKFSPVSSNKFGELPDLDLGRPNGKIVAIFQWVGPGSRLKCVAWPTITFAESMVALRDLPRGLFKYAQRRSQRYQRVGEDHELLGDPKRD